MVVVTESFSPAQGFYYLWYFTAALGYADWRSELSAPAISPFHSIANSLLIYPNPYPESTTPMNHASSNSCFVAPNSTRHERTVLTEGLGVEFSARFNVLTQNQEN